MRGSDFPASDRAGSPPPPPRPRAPTRARLADDLRITVRHLDEDGRSLEADHLLDKYGFTRDQLLGYPTIGRQPQVGRAAVTGLVTGGTFGLRSPESLGMPVPMTREEEAAFHAAQTVGGGLSMLGGAQALAARGIGGGLTAALAARPGAQLATGIAAGLAQQQTELGTGDAGVASLAAMLTSLGVPALAYGAKATQAAIVGPATAAGRQAMATNAGQLARRGITPQLALASPTERTRHVTSILMNLFTSRRVVQQGLLRANAEIAQATDDILRSATPSGQIATPLEAGRAVTQGIEAYVDRMQAKVSRFYKVIGDQMGDAPIIPIATAQRLQEIVGEGQELSRTLGPSTRMASTYLDHLTRDLKDQIARRGEPAVGWDTMDRLRKQLGSIVTGELVEDGADPITAKRLYQAVVEDMEHTVELVGGPQLMRQWRRVKQYSQQWIERRTNLLQPLYQKKTMDQVFAGVEQLVKRNEATGLNAVYRGLTPDQQRVVSTTILQRLGKTTPRATDVSGTMGQMAGAGDTIPFSVTNWVTNLSRISDPKTLAMILKPLGAMGDDYMTIYQHARKLPNVNQLLDPSADTGLGSGFTLMMRQLAYLGAAGATATAAATLGGGVAPASLLGPGLAAAVGVGIAGLAARQTAKAMQHPAFVRLLAQGVTMPAYGLPMAASATYHHALKTGDTELADFLARLLPGIEQSADTASAALRAPADQTYAEVFRRPR